jgi:hypothetical protein
MLQILEVQFVFMCKKDVCYKDSCLHGRIVQVNKFIMNVVIGLLVLWEPSWLKNRDQIKWLDMYE